MQYRGLTPSEPVGTPIASTREACAVPPGAPKRRGSLSGRDVANEPQIAPPNLGSVSND